MILGLRTKQSFFTQPTTARIKTPGLMLVRLRFAAKRIPTGKVRFAMRYENWKVVFEEQRVNGTLQIWAEPFTKLRMPKIFNLRADPYERADITSNTYYDWFMSDGAAVMIAAPAVAGKFLATFKEYPPSQRPSSFSIDQLEEKMRRSFEPQ